MRFPHYLRARVQARDDGASRNEKKTMLNPTKTKNNYNYEGKFRPKLGKMVAATTMQIAYLGVIEA